jgi:hypothetical protein
VEEWKHDKGKQKPNQKYKMQELEPVRDIHSSFLKGQVDNRRLKWK